MRALIGVKDIRIRRQLLRLLERDFECDVGCNAEETKEYFKSSLKERNLYSLVLIECATEESACIADIRSLEEVAGVNWPKSARVIAIGPSEKVVLSAFWKGAEAALVAPFDNQRLLDQIRTLEVEKTLG